jgi:mono/diheme cytochrome c family protein
MLAGLTFGAAMLFASDSTSTVTIHMKKTSPADGKAMYASYCTPCHGVDGRGHGKLSTSLKTPPPDISALSRNHGGVFPEQHVVGVLSHGASVSGHNKPGMPDWGQTLGNMEPNDKLNTSLRIHNLSKYLESLQVK